MRRRNHRVIWQTQITLLEVVIVFLQQTPFGGPTSEQGFLQERSKFP